MSAVLKAFGFEDQLVRVHDRDGAPWFVAQDVCACLGIGNSTKAISTLEDDEKDKLTTSNSQGHERSAPVISESGVYVLIFRSRKPAAKRFRKWVTSEVLPALRRTGQFQMEPANDAALALIEPELPDDAFDEKRAMVALAVVREARQVFGRLAAQRVWSELGLPDPSGGDRMQRAIGVPQSIYDWFDSCAVREAGAVTPSFDLYKSYTLWCSDFQEQVESQSIFGRSLTAMGHVPQRGGFAGNKYGRIARRGIALK